MRSRIRWLALMPLLALAAVFLWQIDGREAAAKDRRVLIRDNDAPSPLDGFDPDQGKWDFKPRRVEVTAGDQVTFRSPAGNDHPHTVTDLALTGPPTNVPASFSAGGIFDSDQIDPGETFTLDTSKLKPGNYAYVCRFHPWMNGEITIK
jgi:plastocyanin